MQEIQNIGHPNFIPGDIVRSKDDNTDYVIHTIQQLGNDILLISGIGVFTYKLKKWHETKVNTFSSQVQRIILNKTKISPKEMLNETQRFIDSITNGDKAMVDTITSTQMHIFRDMLYFAKEADHKGIKKEFLEIAKSLMFINGQQINEQEIQSVLNELLVDSRIDPSFVQYVLKELKQSGPHTFSEAEIRSKFNGFKKLLESSGGSTENLVNKALNANYLRASKLGFYRKRINPKKFYAQPELTKSDKELLDEYLLSNRNPFFVGKPIEEVATVEQRMVSLFRSLFPSPDSPDVDMMVDKLIPDALKTYQRGKKNETLQSMLDAYRDDPQLQHIRNWFESAQESNISVTQPFPYMNQFVKPNISPRFDNLANIRARVDLNHYENLAIGPAESRNMLLSIDKPTFFDQVLEGVTRVKFNGTTHNVSIPVGRDAINDVLTDRVNILMTPQTLKTVRTKAREGKPIDLSWLLNMDGSLRADIDESRLNNLEEIHAPFIAPGKRIHTGPRVMEMKFSNEITKTMGIARGKDFGDTLIRAGLVDDLTAVYNDTGDIIGKKKRLYMLMSEDEKMYGAKSIEDLFHFMNANSIIPMTTWDSIKYVDVDKQYLPKQAMQILGDHYAQLIENGGKERTLISEQTLWRLGKLDIGAKDLRDYVVGKKFPRVKARQQLLKLRKAKTISPAEAFRHGQIEGNLAFLSFRHDQPIRLITSGHKLDLAQQRDMFHRFYTKGGVFLDIENYSGSKFIRQLSWVDSVSSKEVNIHFNDENGNALAGERWEKAFVNAVKRLQKDMKGQDILVTHGETDLNKMITTIQSFTSIDPKEKANLVKSLEYMFTRKNIDLGVLAQFSGHTKFNQQTLMYSVLGETGAQTHDALQDNRDAIKIAMALRSDFEKATSSTDLIRDLDLIDKLDLVFADIQPYSNNRGRLRRLVNITNNRTEGTYTTLWENLTHQIQTDSNGNPIIEFNKTGSFMSEEFKELGLLRASVNNSIQLNSNSIHEMEEVLKVRADVQQREVRSWRNPTQTTVVDRLSTPFSSRDARELGPHAAMDFAAKKEAIGLYDRANMLYQEELSTGKVHINDFQSRWALADNISQRIGQGYSERTKAQLSLMLKDSFEAEILRKDGVAGMFLNSPAAEGLHNILNQGGIESVNKFVGVMHILNAAHADAMKGKLPAIDMGPRINLSFMGESITRDIKDLADINKIEGYSQELSMKVLAKIHPKWNTTDDSVRLFLSEDLKLNVPLLQEQITKLAKDRVIHSEYKDILQNILHGDPNSQETGALTQALQKISKSSKMATSFQAALQEKIDKAEGNIAEVGTRLLTTVNNRTSHGKGFIHSLQEELRSYLDKDHSVNEELKILFRDIKTPDMAEHFLNSMALDETQGNVKNMLSVVDALYHQAPTLNKIYTQAYEAQREAAKDMAMEGIDKAAAFGRAFVALGKEELHKQGINYHELSSAGSDFSVLRELQHRIINQNAAKVAKVSGGNQDLIRSAHTILTEDIKTAYKLDGIKSSVIPLMMIGSMLASTPINDDHFVEGKQSETSPSTVSRYAEIPGSNNGQPNHVWFNGDTTPFRLDITFRGFVESKEQHDALMTSVYDAITGNINTEKVSTRTRDLRKNQTKQRARDLMIF